MDAPFLFLVFAIIYSYFLTKYSSFTIAGVAAGHHFSKIEHYKTQSVAEGNEYGSMNAFRSAPTRISCAYSSVRFESLLKLPSSIPENVRISI